MRTTGPSSAPRSAPRSAIFLDRDGVLIEDRGLLTTADGIIVTKGAGRALRRLKDAGFLLVVVSNQTVIARGLIGVPEMLALELVVERRLLDAGGPALDGFYFCPHHPKATVAEHRGGCDCRKPNPGMLLKASRSFGIDLDASVMIGDRPSDIVAGKRAGCRTILLTTGRHDDPPIEVEGGFTPEAADVDCASWAAAVDWVLAHVPRPAPESVDASENGAAGVLTWEGWA